jgi:hypothetical protein
MQLHSSDSDSADEMQVIRAASAPEPRVASVKKSIGYALPTSSQSLPPPVSMTSKKMQATRAARKRQPTGWSGSKGKGKSGNSGAVMPDVNDYENEYDLRAASSSSTSSQKSVGFSLPSTSTSHQVGSITSQLLLSTITCLAFATEHSLFIPSFLSFPYLTLPDDMRDAAEEEAAADGLARQRQFRRQR